MATLKPIRFSQHAMLKFRVLRDHGVVLHREAVEKVVRHPDKLVSGYRGRLVGQGPLDERRVLRVVYDETPEEIVVVTFYPGRRSKYEQDTV